MINIIFNINKNNLKSLKANICSILHHSKQDFQFNIICSLDEKKEIQSFIDSNTDNIKCKFYNFELNFKNIISQFISNFKNLGKIIYLSNDLLILQDLNYLLGKLEFNEECFLAYSKVFSYDKMFITDLNFWDSQIKINTLKFINLDNILNLKEYNNSSKCSNEYPNIIFWSGSNKPWLNKNSCKYKIWNYYFTNSNNYIYLLYYDNNPSNGRAKLFLDSIKNLNYRLIPHNVYQYENKVTFDANELGKNIKRHYCIKYFIENNGINNYYICSDAYDIYFVRFNYEIIDFVEENKIKILYQNNTLGYRAGLLCNNVNKMYQNQLFDKSFGVNGGSYIGRGYHILNFYSELVKNIKDKDRSDEALMIRISNLYDYITIDTNYFFNADGMYKLFKYLDFKITDVKLHWDFNPSIILFHFAGSHMKSRFDELADYLNDKQIKDMKYSIFRFYFYVLIHYLLYILYPIIKMIIIITNKIINLFT